MIGFNESISQSFCSYYVELKVWDHLTFFTLPLLMPPLNIDFYLRAWSTCNNAITCQVAGSLRNLLWVNFETSFVVLVIFPFSWKHTWYFKAQVTQCYFHPQCHPSTHFILNGLYFSIPSKLTCVLFPILQKYDFCFVFFFSCQPFLISPWILAGMAYLPLIMTTFFHFLKLFPYVSLFEQGV